MKTRLESTLHTLQLVFTTETLASFGNARLVKNHKGKIELLGGPLDDRRAAREWCSRFVHEAAFSCVA